MTEIFFPFKKIKFIFCRLGLLEKEYIRGGNEGMVTPLNRYHFNIPDIPK